MCILDILNKWWNVLHRKVGVDYQILMHTIATHSSYTIHCAGDYTIYYKSNGVQVKEQHNSTDIFLSIKHDADIDILIQSDYAITLFYCYNNALTRLDVKRAKNLTSLYCYNNELTELNVTQNRQVSELNVISNPLTNLSFSQEANYRWVYCDDTDLFDTIESAVSFVNALPTYTDSPHELYISGQYAESIVKPIAEAKGWYVEIA